MKTAIELLTQERNRQINEFGYSDEYIKATEEDYGCGELALAAACYCEPLFKDNYFPWPEEYFKPSPQNRVRDLVKAGAMIIAEIDRLNSIK